MDEVQRLFDAQQDFSRSIVATMDALVVHLKTINTELARLEARLSAVERTLAVFVERLAREVEAHAQRELGRET